MRSARRPGSRRRTRAGTASGRGRPPPRGRVGFGFSGVTLPPPPPPSSSGGVQASVGSVRATCQRSPQKKDNPMTWITPMMTSSSASGPIRAEPSAPRPGGEGSLRYHRTSPMSATATTLEVSSRTPEGSRSARRLRRQGLVPGVVYGGDGDCVSIQVDALALNRSLAGAGAGGGLAIDGETTNVIVKDPQRHPVTGRPLHVDFLRVRMDVAIASTVVVELEGAEDAPGAKEGGVLEQVTRELNVEALPRDIPDSLTLDVSGMEMNDTLTLEALNVPGNVQLLDEPDTVLATVTPPRLSVEPDEEIETETELVGEEGGEEAADEGDEPRPDDEQGTVPG